MFFRFFLQLVFFILDLYLDIDATAVPYCLLFLYLIPSVFIFIWYKVSLFCSVYYLLASFYSFALTILFIFAFVRVDDSNFLSYDMTDRILCFEIFIYEFDICLFIFYPRLPYNALVGYVHDLVVEILDHLKLDSQQWLDSYLVIELKRDLLDCLSHQQIGLAQNKIKNFIDITYPRLMKPL